MAVMALRAPRVNRADAIGTPMPADLIDVEPAAPTIHFDDLVPDALGEIVLLNDSLLRSLNLIASVPVVSHGEASTHVTLSGDDVSGFRQMRFANGVTVFYPRELVVRVMSHNGA